MSAAATAPARRPSIDIGLRKISLEKLLTHPSAFALPATTAQRAICRAVAGEPLAELASDPVVLRIFGGPDAVGALREMEGTVPKECYLIAGIRGGKSLFAACLSVWCGLTADLSILSQHEVARVPLVSLSIDQANIILEHLFGAARRPFLARRLVGKLPEFFKGPNSAPVSVKFRRDDGKVFEVKVAAGKRAGRSLVSRWTAGCTLDECARMSGPADGVVNFTDSRKAVIDRIPTGATLFCPSSPWAPRGPVYEAVMEGFGHPTPARLVIRARGPDMNPKWWTPERCALSRDTPNGSYQTDVLGEFADAEGTFMPDAILRECQTREAMHAEPDPSANYVAAMDPATRSNAWTLVIVGRFAAESGEATEDEFVVAYHQQWQGSSLEPLKAGDVLPEIRAILKRYGLREVHSDQWGGDLLIEHGELQQVQITVHHSTREDTARRALDFKGRVLAKKVQLPPDAEVRADLASTKKTLTPNGMHIGWPVTADGRHCDYAPAIVLGVDLAASGSSWADAMERWAQRGYQ